MATAQDVVIVGGGIAGCAAAIRLRQLGAAAVTIVHRSTQPSFRIGETLQPQARPLLETLRIYEDAARLPHVEAQGICSAWGDAELVYNDHLFHTAGKGWLLDRAAFDRCFLDKARSLGVTVIDSALYGSPVRDGERWHLQTVDGTALSCRFLVDASGRSSALAAGLGIRRVRFDDLHAVYTLWKGRPAGLTRHTLIEGVENGWCYAVALPDEHFIVAVFSDKPLIKRLQLKRADAFRSFVRQTIHLREFLGEDTSCLSSRVALADSSLLDTIGSEQGWLAVGDAAAAFDPLSSMGIAKAMESGIAAAAAITEWLMHVPGAIDVYCMKVEASFAEYLQQRCRYYGMETRWRQQPFWASRQSWLGLHPEQAVRAVPQAGRRVPDRILNAAELATLKSICSESPLLAHELVRRHQAQAKRPRPDWRVIQAIRFLIDSGHLVATPAGPFVTKPKSGLRTPAASAP